MTATPIADHAFLSDCNSAALVTSAGSVDWLAFPRFDSPSVCARLLDDRAGHFRVGVAGDADVTRRYLDDSLVLETTFRTPDGVVRLTDALALGAGERDHEVGGNVPHALLRHVQCDEGTVTVEVEFVPRPEYGRTSPLVRATSVGVATHGGPDALDLATDVDLTVEDDRAGARLVLTAGDTASFALQWSRSWEPRPAAADPADVRERLDDTVAAWSSWAAHHQSYDGVHRDLVRFSGAVLQGLTFQPTGAIVAAATTSLPEVVGGERNWDYRHTWLRDAAMTLDALWVAACPDEADHFLAWLLGVAPTGHDDEEPLQIMFGVAGEHDLAERTLDHLDGWRDSRPVRVGNGAARQRQHDVYGEVLDAVARLRDQVVPLDDPTQRMLRGLADAAVRDWERPDKGIWEVRGEPRHFLHSKLMCWVAVDRALRLADDLDASSRDRERWRDARAAMRTAILEHGFHDDVGAFTQSFGSRDLDASALRIPLVGFLPGDDDRVVATTAAIAEHLTDDRGFVHRYRNDDGLDGDEGSFLLCTFWLVQALAAAGDVGRARDLFEDVVAVRNDVDLLAEEYGDGELLGNFPQAFSHVGLVNAAWSITRAEREGHGEPASDHPTDAAAAQESARRPRRPPGHG